jgi:hypothetical protein
VYKVTDRNWLLIQQVGLRVGLAWPDNMGQAWPDDKGLTWPKPKALVSSAHEFLAFGTATEDLLDIIDAILFLTSRATFNARKEFSVVVLEEQGRRPELQRLFNDARSVYQINQDGSGLDRRVDPKAAQILDSAVRAAAAQADAGSAAEQLREASDSVRALHPDAKKAYRMAVTAVESAAHAVIEPTNKKATLGTMLRKLETNPTAFEVEIAGKDRCKGSITPVTGIMRMLWDGQTSRHGSKEPARDETREEAEMAVQLASMLVLWFTTGMIRQL